MKQSLPNTIHLVDAAIERLMDELMVQLVDAPDSPENRVNAILQADKARRTMCRAIHNAGMMVDRLNGSWTASDPDSYSPALTPSPPRNRGVLMIVVCLRESGRASERGGGHAGGRGRGRTAGLG